MRQGRRRFRASLGVFTKCNSEAWDLRGSRPARRRWRRARRPIANRPCPRVGLGKFRRSQPLDRAGGAREGNRVRIAEVDAKMRPTDPEGCHKGANFRLGVWGGPDISYILYPFIQTHIRLRLSYEGDCACCSAETIRCRARALYLHYTL